MPWTITDVEHHTKAATTPELKELWVKVANNALEKGASDASAIREANWVINRKQRKFM